MTQALTLGSASCQGTDENDRFSLSFTFRVSSGNAKRFIRTVLVTEYTQKIDRCSLLCLAFASSLLVCSVT